MKLQLPLPVASAAPQGTSLMEQPFSVLDEGDWPGGIVQRFRALRPLIDATLDGYDPQFLGMLEDPADGMGCWSIGSDTTVVGLITNATFANFAKLCQGGYGSRPLQAGHTLVAVNPDWTRPEGIGQFWDRKLKAAAEDVLSSPWDVLYSCQMVRTSRGKGYGLLVGSYGLGWHLWSADEDTSSSVRDPCILWSLTRPEQADLVAAVNEAAAANDTGKPGVLGGLLDQWQKTRQK